MGAAGGMSKTVMPCCFESSRTTTTQRHTCCQWGENSFVVVMHVHLLAAAAPCKHTPLLTPGTLSLAAVLVASPRLQNVEGVYGVCMWCVAEPW
jgi:hypothetical protein